MSNLRVAKTEEFDKIFSILENSFPPDEYRTYEGQKFLWNHPKYTVYVIPDDESQYGNLRISPLLNILQ